MSLEEAIEQQIALGQSDPRVIAEKVASLHGEDWLRAEVSGIALDVCAELARHKLGAIRRSAELALRPGDQMASAEMKIAKTWVPREGWKPTADLTENDLHAKATWYRALASAASRRAMWCDEVIALMRSEGARKLGRLKAALPPLPPEEGLALDA